MKAGWHRAATALTGFVLAFLLATGSAPGQEAKYPIEILPSIGGNTLYPIALAKDGRFAAIPAGNGAQLWDLEKGRLVRRFTGLPSNPTSVDISSDGKWIAAASNKGIHVWE